MKLIKISTDLKLTVHDFPAGDYGEQNRKLCELIGSNCDLYEYVMPRRLYTELGGAQERGNCVGMLIDEDGLYHDLDFNYVGSYLYETDKHGHQIVGTILIIGECWGEDGIDFCGMPEEQFTLLYPKLEELTKKAREDV